MIITTDGGVTWIRQNCGSANTLLGIKFINADYGFAVGADGTIIRTAGGSVQVPFSIVQPDDYILENNYPNPFNPNTTISFSIPSSGFTTLKVYDILGNEVATLVNEEKPAGNYEVSFNASSLSSGTYFYRIQAGSFIETRKMILMK